MRPRARYVTVPLMNQRGLILSSILFAAACGGTSSALRTPSKAPPAPEGVALVATAFGDIDSRPDREVLSIYADGTLLAGGWQGKAEVPTSTDWFKSQQSKISAEVLDQAKGSHVIIVALPTEEDEDPPNRYQLFVPGAGGLTKIYDQVIGVYGVTDLRFPGDGTVRYIEDSWSACGSPHGEATEHDGTVPIHEVTLALDASGQLVEHDRTESGQTFDCGGLAACPWIYVDGATGPVRVGEILRNVRGHEAYVLQDLALPAVAAGPLHVRVAEEKDEVTFLDEIYVEVDGLHLAPTACAAATAPAYCAADHQPLRLQKGDVLDLTFDLPSGATPTVFARGYYIPLTGTR